MEHRRLNRRVADRFRALIEDGGLAPGARHPSERGLTEKLGISRPTIRATLIALEVEGKIRIRVGCGIYVAEEPPPDHPPFNWHRLHAVKSIVPNMSAQLQSVQAEGAFEVLRARELIEAAIAQEAARQASPKDIAASRAILSAMVTAAKPCNPAWMSFAKLCSPCPRLLL